MPKKINDRLKEIKQWIGFSDDDLAKWKQLSFSFANWFSDGIINNKITKEDFNLRFPVLW